MPAFSPLPFNLLVGPISPSFYSAEHFICNSLNSIYSLGGYLEHPQITPFFIHAEALETSLHKDHSAFKIFPEQRAELHFYPEYVLAPLLAELQKTRQLDLLIWWGLQHGLPHDLLEITLPKILILSDWHLHYGALDDMIACFDYVLCDEKFRQFLAQKGQTNCAYWPAYGFDAEMIPADVGAERDIDLVFVGSTEPHKYRQRNHYLDRLARLSHHLVIRSDLKHQEYLRYLQRSKITFNHALRQEMNMRAYEATACGSLLLMEEDNLEIQYFLTPGQDYVAYNQINFESVVAYYLTHSEEREGIAKRGQQKIAAFTFHQQFSSLLQRLPKIYQEICVQKPARKSLNPAVSEQNQPGLSSETHIQFSWRLNLAALALSSDVPRLRIAVIHDLMRTLDRSLEKSQRLMVLNALLVAYTDWVCSDLKEHRFAQHMPIVLPQIIQEIEALSADIGWIKMIVFNLAWAAFLTRDLSACSRWVALWTRLPDQSIELALSLFVLPVRMTSLHYLYQQAIFQDLTDPMQTGCFLHLKQHLERGILFLMAYIALSHKDQRLALATFQRINSTGSFASSFPEAYFEQSRLLLQQGDKQAAFKALKSGIEAGVFYSGAWWALLHLAADCLDSEQQKALQTEVLNLFQDQQHQAFRAQLSSLGERC